MNITFLSMPGEVTGSRYLLEYQNTKLMVDCGLFQGLPEVEKYNWQHFPVDPRTINAIVLTHAHLDHSGYIPVLVKHGFRGKVYCSRATRELCNIVLQDSAFLQQEDAKYMPDNGSGKKAEPLYTLEDVQRAMSSFQAVKYETDFSVGPFKIRLIPSDHILGSSFVQVSDGKKTITFSGDLGRPNQLIMKSPTHIQTTDFLVLESTYGDQLHPVGNPIEEMAQIINAAIAKHGVIIIPAFAIERTQTILYCLYRLLQQNKIPKIPVFVDSPMAIKVSRLFENFKEEHLLADHEYRDMFAIANNTYTIPESKHIDELRGSIIVVAGSGMADGGRVVHHFKHHISDSKNTILFVGFQAPGTNGRALVDGASSIDIDGKLYDVRATIKLMDIFSAHADYEEILQWLSFYTKAPRKVFLTHGELPARQSLQKKIEQRFGWSVSIPNYLESFELD